MERTALDALNKGWALGLGTRIRATDPDMEAALARGGEVRRKPERPIRAEWLLLLAMGPLPRALH